MRFSRISRRHFLQGAGGYAMSLPFLSSLWPKELAAETPAGAKFFIHFSTTHGGFHPRAWSPDTRNVQWAAHEQTVMYAGDPLHGLAHTIRHKPLTQLLTNGRVSPIFDEQFNAILPKMNILDGFALMFGGGHHTGGFLGNNHGTSNRNRITGVDPQMEFIPPIPTIDQIMARSLNFYGPSDPRTIPVLNLGGGETPSYKLFNGSIQPTMHAWHLQQIFDFTFGDSAGVQANPANVPLLNRVYEDYQRLVSPQGVGARLSSEDRGAVEHHMDSIDQVQRRIANLSQVASCNAIGSGGTRYGPTDPRSTINAFHQQTRELYATHWDTYVNMIVTAINCGLCRIFTIPLGSPSDYSGDYHENVAHQWNTTPAQALIQDAHEFVATRFILPLLTRLNDVQTVGGGRLLDNGLVVWQPECWHATHELKDLPTMMAGGAGGFFRTGYYIDFRNLSNRGLQRNAYDSDSQTFDPNDPYIELYPGVPMGQWLHNVLLSMGVGRAEYMALTGLPSNTTMYGYGDHTVQQGYTSLTFRNGASTVTHHAFPQRVIEGSNSFLPFLKA